MDVAPSAQSGWLKFAALVLGVGAVGLPINNLGSYHVAFAGMAVKR